MRAFPKYDRYRDSGVDWVGEVPEHWDVLPGRVTLSLNKEKNAGNVEDTILSLSYGRLVIKPPEKLTGLVPESFEGYQIINPGDIIIRPTDLQNDWTSLRVGLAKDRGIITSAYLGLKHDGKVSSEYLYYLLHSYDLLKVYYGMGTGLRQNLSWDDFKYLPLTLPPKPEQDRIVTFLDSKTAEIDALIAKKQRQIELLDEQKAILINRAVTRGLPSTGSGQANPNPGSSEASAKGDAKLKPSGIEWIGEIPEGWETGKVRHLFDNLNNRRIPLSTVDRGKMTERTYDYYGASGVIDKVEGYLYDEDLLLIAEDGANLVFRNLPLAIIATGKYWVNNHAHILRTKSGPLHYWFHALECADYTTSITGAAQPKLTKDALASISLPNPPPEEQEKIVEHIQKNEEAERRLRGTVESQIQSLKTLRSTLIAHAVTGRIKV